MHLCHVNVIKPRLTMLNPYAEMRVRARQSMRALTLGSVKRDWMDVRMVEMLCTGLHLSCGVYSIDVGTRGVHGADVLEDGSVRL